jgi:type I restriction enzyme M protein
MNRKELYNEAWRASDIMRRDDGTNGINEYIEQISWMFFLKVFEDLEKRFDATATLDGKKYSRVIPEKYSWSKWTKKKSTEIIDYVDTELFPFLANLSGTSEKDTVGMIFQEIRRNKMKSASNLKDVVDIINKIDFNSENDSHVLSLFYEDLLLKLGKESGLAGEFYTPRPIVKLIVKMIDPKLNLKNKENIRILDPFCGSCGFLAESFKFIMNSKISAKDIPILQQNVFHGIEKKSLSFLVGLMNCILHGLTTPNIERKNSLNQNILKFDLEDKFDYIMTNPPFGGKENKQIQQNFPVKLSATELLSLQLVMRRLKPNGKCGIVVPEGLLFGSGKFAEVKKELLENYNVYAIISLPAGVFANVSSTGQGVKTNILLFEKNGKTKKIWYYDLVPTRVKKFTKKNPILDEDLEDCFTKFTKKAITENSKFVDVEEIISNDYDMALKKQLEEEEIMFTDPFEELKKIKKLHKEIELNMKDIEELLKISNINLQ